MKRRDFLLAAGALAAPLGARAQAKGVPRVGVILYSDAYAPVVEGLRAGLKALGAVEGRHFVIDTRDGKGDVKAIEAAARVFERERAALIYSVPTSATTVVMRATTEIPVVFCVGTDPIATGFVQSYAKPGGRLTGVHYLTVDLTPKRLELLKDLLPKLARVVTFYNPHNPAAQLSARSAREAAKKLGVQLIERHVRSQAEVRAALGALRPGEADAIFFVADVLLTVHFDIVIERAKAIRMPTMVFDVTLAERGALVSYGVNLREVGRQSANHVQRMLAGARPGDLPVENVTHLTFALNRRTAKEIGVAVPPAMIVRFDRVIE